MVQVRFLVLFYGWRVFHKIPLPRINTVTYLLHFVGFSYRLCWVWVLFCQSKATTATTCCKLFNNTLQALLLVLYFIGIFLLYHTRLDSHLRAKHLWLFCSHPRRTQTIVARRSLSLTTSSQPHLTKVGTIDCCNRQLCAILTATRGSNC